MNEGVSPRIDCSPRDDAPTLKKRHLLKRKKEVAVVIPATT